MWSFFLMWSGVLYFLLKSSLYHNFVYIFQGFPRRTHHVRTAEMSLSKKQLSRNSCIKRLQEHIKRKECNECIKDIR